MCSSFIHSLLGGRGRLDITSYSLSSSLLSTTQKDYTSYTCFIWGLDKEKPTVGVIQETQQWNTHLNLFVLYSENAGIPHSLFITVQTSDVLSCFDGITFYDLL